MSTKSRLLEKDRLVAEELSDIEPLLILLHNGDSGDKDLLIITRTRTEISVSASAYRNDAFFKAIGGGFPAPTHNNNAGTKKNCGCESPKGAEETACNECGGGSDDSLEEDTTIDNTVIVALTALGIGDEGELRVLLNAFRRFAQDEFETHNVYESFHISVLNQLGALMNKEFRQRSVEVPFRAEMSVISLVTGSQMTGSLGIYRIKADGGFHSAFPFCILGGYQEVEIGEETKRKVTVRHLAREWLEELYKKGLPNTGEARAMAKKILDLDSRYRDEPSTIVPLGFL